MIERVPYDSVWMDRNRLAETVHTAGLSARAAEAKAVLFAQAACGMPAESADAAIESSTGFFVPGRIEVLGKHTDYAGGRTIVAATERGFCLIVAPRCDNHIRITDVGVNQTVAFSLADELTAEIGHWSNYPLTVARRLVGNFPGISRGADVAFASDLPVAAGLSSSSALMIGVFLALAEVNDLWRRPELCENIRNRVDLAGYLATIENGQTFRQLTGDAGVGTFGGSEDHTAILCCQPNQLSEYSYCPVEFRRSLPMPEGYTFVVGSSGVVAAKTGAAMDRYNRAARLAQQLAERWQRETGRDEPHLAAILASSDDAADRLQRMIDRLDPEDTLGDRPALQARFDHFRHENQEVLPVAEQTLVCGDVTGFGQVVEQSQRGAEQWLGNQVSETVFLASSAREQGAAAASAFGAGFGGSVWALVPRVNVDVFLERWSAAYRSRFPQHADRCQFFETGAGPATFQLGGSAESASS